MKITLQRLYHTQGNPPKDYTCGFLAIEQHEFNCFVVEDVYRAIKVPGDTRIPAGEYKLEILKVDNDWVINHRIKYNTNPNDQWFKYPIHLLDVPEFQGILIHAGIDPVATQGCLLLNYNFDTSAIVNPGAKSTVAVEAFYKLVYPIIESGIDTRILIRDESFLNL